MRRREEGGAHLRRPVQGGDYAMLGPVLVVEESAQRQAGTRAQVSEKRQVKYIWRF